MECVSFIIGSHQFVSLFLFLTPLRYVVVSVKFLSDWISQKDRFYLTKVWPFHNNDTTVPFLCHFHTRDCLSKVLTCIFHKLSRFQMYTCIFCSLNVWSGIGKQEVVQQLKN